MARRGSRSLSINVDDAAVQANLLIMERRVDAAIGAVMDRSGDQAVAYMKVNAPWTDRTGNARNGLGKVLFRQGRRWVLNLFGRANYQIYLERNNGGRYAIIGPTLLIWGPRTMAQVRGLLGRLR